MKILQINNYFYLRGGSERYFFDLSEMLRLEGHQVVEFSMVDNANQSSKFSDFFASKVYTNKFNFINIVKFFYNYDAVRKLKKLISQERPDVAHLHNIAHHLSPGIIRVLKNKKIPVVMTLHDYKIICPNYKLYTKGKVCSRCKNKKYFNCFVNKCFKGSYLKSFLGMCESYLNNYIFNYYNKIDLFVAPSMFIRDTFTDFGIDEKKIVVMNNFLKDGSEVYDEKKDYYLYFGRLSKEKGVDLLVSAFKDLPGLELLIVGEGDEKFNLLNMIKDYGLESHVRLLGKKYDDELWNIVKKAQAVIMPSRWPENLPYSALEALSLSTPVIASGIGGLKEIVKVGENGFLFTSGDKNDLVAKIKLFESSDKKAMQIAAFKSAEKYNKNLHKEKILNIYKDLILSSK